jgi:hypothetical protein
MKPLLLGCRCTDYQFPAVQFFLVDQICFSLYLTINLSTCTEPARMEKANTHYLLRYYGEGEEEEEGYHESGCKVDKHHPLRQLLRKLPQTYMCQGTSKKI